MKPPSRKGLFFEEGFVGFDAGFVALQGFRPFLMTAVAGIGNNRFGVFLKHGQAGARFDDVKIVGMDVAGLGRSGGFDHMAGRTTPGPLGLGGIAVFGVFADGSRSGKPLVFSMAGKTEIVVVVGFQ